MLFSVNKVHSISHESLLHANTAPQSWGRLQIFISVFKSLWIQQLKSGGPRRPVYLLGSPILHSAIVSLGQKQRLILFFWMFQWSMLNWCFVILFGADIVVKFPAPSVRLCMKREGGFKFSRFACKMTPDELYVIWILTCI